MSWVQTAYLIAEVVAIPLTGFLTRLLSMCWLFVLSVSVFTLASIGCAASDHFLDADRMARSAGLFRRHADPGRLFGSFPPVPSRASGSGDHIRWCIGGAWADRRTDRRRLDHRDLFLALAVPDQCRARDHFGDCRRHPVAKGADAARRGAPARRAVAGACWRSGLPRLKSRSRKRRRGAGPLAWSRVSWRSASLVQSALSDERSMHRVRW